MLNNASALNAAPPPGAEPIKHRSISKQLTVSLMIAIGVISIAVIAVMHAYRLDAARDELGAKADEIFAYLSGILEKSLWDIDENNIQVIGETISQNELVARLVIRDSFNDTIYEMVREAPSNTIDRAGDVFHEGTQVGHVAVSLTKRFYHAGSRQLLFASLLTLLIALIVLIVTAGYLIRRFLKGPLDSLNAFLDTYSAGDYEPRSAKIPYLEFQQFGRVLEEMGEKSTASSRRSGEPRKNTAIFSRTPLKASFNPPSMADFSTPAPPWPCCSATHPPGS